MILCIPYVFFLVPETKGVPLEDMDALFSKELKTWKAHAVVMQELQRRNAVVSMEAGPDTSSSQGKGSEEVIESLK